MSRVADHLAELTGFRDRDALDATLVSALHDLLRPLDIAIYRIVGEGEDRRWFTRARLAAGELVPSADPLWADLSALPPLAEHPVRQTCLRQREGLMLDGQPALTLLPLDLERDCDAVLELRSHAPLGAEQLRLIGSVLRVYRNFQSLLDYSERDTLTGLLNRKTFDESFMRCTVPLPPPSRDALGQRRGGGAAWLGVVDIDHFKHVNDCHGHLIGDEVLLLLSRLMRGVFRQGDQLYRFGGEEFVVLMRCDDGEAAGRAFERLRATIEEHAFPRVGRITVSIGFTAVRPGDTPSSAFERADQAVYFVKQNGRNRVASHTELVARGDLVEHRQGGDDVVLF
ncbi:MULTISPECIES: GGDEF domain-containing protein [unclassified Rubrivivax]|uniref:GGDEF domain-containing protein n=1 Tax=unclassified Rubrivivax TaxID=2649762 RepID=UPI001E3EE238|nr:MULTISPECIES: GGDEF domain-containing protein [unclassified Rubrivivax]MCC9595557.1 GGDEF domain-containing protein [Rubrivivax sp. JA1055]MCC9646936.1 GGDEF domain-containing protein [Rubrivivax sp. JA1029]